MAEVLQQYHQEPQQQQMPREGVSWQTFLSNFRAVDLVYKQQILFVLKTDTLLETLRMFNTNKISSCPVYDEDANKFIGMVDVLDVAAACISRRGTSAQELEGLTMDKVMNASQRDEMKTAGDDSSLFHIMNMLSDPHTHRVALINEKGKCVGIITQSLVAEWLYRVKDKPTFPQRIKEVKLREHRKAKVVKDVKSIDCTLPLSEAFKAMLEHKVSGLVVVNEKQHFLGNVSAGDLKQMTLQSVQQLLDVLDKPIMEAKKLSREALQRATLDVSTGALIDKFVASRVHRIYIVASPNDLHLVGIVALGDLILEIAYVQAQMERI